MDRPRLVSTLAGGLVVASVAAVDPWGWMPFGPAKWWAMTVLPWLALAGAAWGGASLNRTATFGWIAFTAWAAVTSAMALDSVAAWVGSPDRRFGFAGVFTLGAAFVVGQSLDDRRHTPARAAVVAASIMGGWAFLEMLGWQPVDLTLGTDRLAGPYGSPAYTAAAAVLLGPISAGVGASAGPRGWRVAGAVGAAACALVVIASGTRGAWLAMVIVLALWAPRRLGRRGARRWPAVAVVAGIAAATALSPVGGRLADAVTGDAARGRLDEWTTGLAAVAERPVMGAGLEGYRIVFPSVVDADYVRRHGRDVVTDRAHDGALDLAVATGIPGGVAYLVAAGWLTVLGVRAVRRQDAVMAGVGMGVIGYLAQQVFLFPTLEIDPVFWLFAGLLVVAETAPRLDLGRWPAVPALLLAVTLAAAGGLEMAADRHARQALEVAATGDLRRAVDEALAATRLRPEGFRYRLLVADIAVQATEGLDIARSQTDAARRLSPLDPAVALAQAEVLLRRALATEAAVDLDPARQAFEDLSRSDPLHPRVWLRLGLAAALQGDAGPAEQAWKRAEDLAPAAVEATLSLARLYVETGRDDDAREALERARRIDPDAAAATEEQLGSKG